MQVGGRQRRPPSLDGDDAEHPAHRQDSCVDILPVEIPAEADLLNLDFIRTKRLCRPPDAVILGVIEAADVIGIEAYFRGEEL